MTENETTTDPTLQEVRDRLDVAEVLSRYAQGWDSRDFELVKACFLPDATIRYESLPPLPGGFAEFFEMERNTILRLDRTQHLIGNVHVTVDGDTAACVSYVQATHFSAEGETWTTGGRYDDHMLRTGTGWRIADRLFTRQWRYDPTGFSLRFLAN